MFADANGLIIQPEKLIEIKISVAKVYKGEISSKIITIYTSPSSAACGDLNFKENQEYFIYGSSNAQPFYYQAHQNSFWTSKCSGNRLFNELHRQELTQYFD